MTIPSRSALYYAPESDDPLWHLGNAWLGRDPQTGAALPQDPHRAEITAAPRHYGLHATLRAPMRLRTPPADVLRCAETIAAATAAFPLPALEVAILDGFLALTLTAPCPALHRLAADCVRATDGLRAPPGRDERARRERAALNPHQARLLARWGYPQVMEEWVFHITLSRRLAPLETAPALAAAASHFAAALNAPRLVRSLCIFVEEHSQPMHLAHRLPLRSDNSLTSPQNQTGPAQNSD